jgi:hypothetical protein
MDTAKIRKLVQKLEYTVCMLTTHKDLQVHQKVNQFLYMERVEEMKFLVQELEHLAHRLSFLESVLERQYVHAYCAWRRDIRFLHHFIRKERQ